MAEKTGITWCDSSFNGWIGCSPTGPGCSFCYAEADFDHRKHRVKWGSGNPRSRTSVANWKKPLQWNAKPFYECRCCGWRGDASDAEFSTPRQGCIHDLAPARRRVFSASLSDVFDNEVPDEWRADLFKLIESTPNLDWLLLTKRIGNVERMVPWSGEGWPGHVWLGATIVNQAEADRDIPKLLRIPAAMRFLSMEPLLGSVRFRWDRWLPVSGFEQIERDRIRTVDLVIVGGESGPFARSMDPPWVDDIQRQCEALRIPFFFKQWGGRTNKGDCLIDGLEVKQWPMAA